MSERLSTAEASEATGIPQPTIKHWLGQGLPIPAEKDGAGRWRFGADALAVLRAVKELREQDRTFDTIRRRLDPEIEMSASSSAPSGDDAEMSGRSSAPSAASSSDERPPSVDERTLAESLAAAVTPQLIQALEAQQDLAEKYARAAHHIGQLEERVANLTTQLGEERERHVRELEAAKAQIALLEQPARPRPWWRLWG